MNKYIFITDEGYTFQPNSSSLEPDCENAQVLGIVAGENENDAFKNLLEQNDYLIDSSFNEIYCYKLDSDCVINNFNLRKEHIYF